MSDIQKIAVAAIKAFKNAGVDAVIVLATKDNRTVRHVAGNPYVQTSMLQIATYEAAKYFAEECEREEIDDG